MFLQKNLFCLVVDVYEPDTCGGIRFQSHVPVYGPSPFSLPKYLCF